MRSPRRRSPSPASPSRTDQEQAQLEIVGRDLPRPLERPDALRVLLEPLVRLHQQPGGGVALLQLERALGDRREHLPALRGREFLAQGQQRLVRTLDLAVQRASDGEQVLDRGARIGLAQARRALVAQEGNLPVGQRLLSKCFQLFAVFGREVLGLVTPQNFRAGCRERSLDLEGG